MMPACTRIWAWAFSTLECVCRRSSSVPRSSGIAYHSDCSRVLRITRTFNRVTPTTRIGLDLTSKFNSVLGVRSCSRISMSTEMSQRMVWVDLEMTGLDIERDQIIEMACLITDSDLNIMAEGPNLIIKQPDELLDGMSSWCKEHHGKSGLTQAVRDSKITLEQAQYEFLSFIRQHTPPGQCPLAGNSVHADKRFLDKYMPQFMYHLHYRIIDVSTIKELCRRWFPEDYKKVPQKKATHRALEDIRESIKELQFYRANIFKASTEEKKRKIIESRDNNIVSSNE